MKAAGIWENIMGTNALDTLCNDITFIDNIRNIGAAAPVKIENNVFVFCLKGQIQADVNNNTLKACAGDMIILPAQAAVTDVLFSNDYESKALIISTPTLHLLLHGQLDAWNQAVYVDKHTLVHVSPEDFLVFTKFYELGKQVFATKRHEDVKAQVQIGLIFALLSWIVGIISNSVKPQNLPSIGGSYFSRFISMLDSEEVKYHTVSYYAQKLYITPKYLSILCKRCSGKSAKEWIHDYVSDDIRFYLKATDKEVKEIAAQLGFPNASFFGKYAKDLLGMSPNAYRSSYRLKEVAFKKTNID